MIKIFRSKEAEKLWNRQRSAKLPFSIQSKSRDKLSQIDSAIQLEDLRFPPGDRLELLSGDRRRVGRDIPIAPVLGLPASCSVR